MSLDVYLTLPGAAIPGGSGIFIREHGAKRELTRAEWDERFPGKEPVVAIQDTETDEVYSANITHNLNRMATAAGLYEPLWQPNENGWAQAGELIEPIEKGLALLRADPERFRAFNPPNGWGDYEGLVKFTAKYLDACRAWPNAAVRTWR